MNIKIQRLIGFGSRTSEVFKSQVHDIRGAVIEALESMRTIDITPESFNLFREDKQYDVYNLPYLDLSDMCLAGADLSGLNLRSAPDFSSSNCKEMNFQNSVAIGADFTNANCQKVNFSDADLRSSQFDGADVRGAIWAHAKVRGATFYDATMDKAGLVYILHNGGNLYRNPIKNFIVRRQLNKTGQLAQTLKEQFCR
jgi:hypothetical protein